MLTALSCVALAVGSAVPPAPAPGKPPVSVLEEVASIVEQSFYSAARLEQVGWTAALARARASYARASDAAARTSSIRELLAALGTSHTSLYPRDDPGYWALASIFEPALPRLCAKERLPELPVTRDDIGVFWKQVGGGWFVAGVYAGGPAAKAGLKVGDQVLTAEGNPFSPVQSLAGKAGKPVAIQVKRARDGAPLALEVTPRATRPHEEFRQASAESFRIIDHRGTRIAYVHIWAWTGGEIQQALLEMIARANAQAVDGFILDLRDGWGGAATHYLSVFFRDAPVLESINREGKSQAFDYQIRKPAVLLINGGTRSGKETIAYGAKKHGLARLVGERTAGAVTFGQPFCLSDGSLMLLAVADARVDGERLEGRGVSPDIEVPFELRYADGRDPQLDRALEVLSGEAAAKP
jgi:carboxyl-terminal processing protease